MEMTRQSADHVLSLYTTIDNADEVLMSEANVQVNDMKEMSKETQAEVLRLVRFFREKASAFHARTEVSNMTQDDISESL